MKEKDLAPEENLSQEDIARQAPEVIKEPESLQKEAEVTDEIGMIEFGLDELDIHGRTFRSRRDHRDYSEGDSLENPDLWI